MVTTVPSSSSSRQRRLRCGGGGCWAVCGWWLLLFLVFFLVRIVWVLLHEQYQYEMARVERERRIRVAYQHPSVIVRHTPTHRAPATSPTITSAGTATADRARNGYKSSNNQLFISFLAMLRNKYLDAQEGQDNTFHSIILAGLHDVKTLKLKKGMNHLQ